MSENSFNGKLYLALTSGGFETQPTYSAQTGFSIPSLSAITPEQLDGIVYTMSEQSDLEISSKAKGKSEDGEMTSTVISEEVTGKINVAINATLYPKYVTALQGVECELRLVDSDCDRMVQVLKIKPHFAPTTKVGEMQLAEMTFSYTQAANIAAQKKRYRLVTLTPATP